MCERCLRARNERDEGSGGGGGERKSGGVVVSEPSSNHPQLGIHILVRITTGDN
jgi:hypothetical protein